MIKRRGYELDQAFLFLFFFGAVLPFIPFSNRLSDFMTAFSTERFRLYFQNEKPD